MWKKSTPIPSQNKTFYKFPSLYGTYTYRLHKRKPHPSLDIAYLLSRRAESTKMANKSRPTTVMRHMRDVIKKCISKIEMLMLFHEVMLKSCASCRANNRADNG